MFPPFCGVSAKTGLARSRCVFRIKRTSPLFGTMSALGQKRTSSKTFEARQKGKEHADVFVSEPMSEPIVEPM